MYLTDMGRLGQEVSAGVSELQLYENKYTNDGSDDPGGVT